MKTPAFSHTCNRMSCSRPCSRAARRAALLADTVAACTVEIQGVLLQQQMDPQERQPPLHGLL